MLVRAPYISLFILAVCWFRHNAAIPLASHSSNQMQDTFKEEKIDSQTNRDDTTLDSVMEEETLDVISDEDINENDESDENTISNQNVNINMNKYDGHHHIVRNRDKHHKQNTTENISVTEHGTLEEASTNCTSNNKKNQRYSSSFAGNTTERALTVENEFHKVVGNNSKVKKTSSVHEGEDITLCWIETTTIKEDKTTRPPKRLVIREYTISFENSATIPERYLECKKFEGELTANDPDVSKTALFEIIDEDTMVSRIVNFTSVSHVGNILIWEHKRVKCGVGPVVSKNIIEINDNSKNPKKRVEIKVSPKMHQLTAMTTEEECTESSEEIEESSTLIESTTEHTTGLPCENAENGVCEATTTSASISTKREVSTTEEIIIELQSKTESESQEELNLSTSKSPDEEASRRSTTFPKISTTIQEYQEKTDCTENSSDLSCLTKKDGTSSSEDLFPLVTTEAVRTAETLSTPIGERETITKEGISIPSIEERLEEITTESLFTSGEEEEITSDLVAKETTPFAIATDISMESSETYVPQSTDQAAIDTTTLKTEIITSHSVTEHIEEHSKPEEGSGDNSIELTSEELDKIDHVLSSSEVDVGQYVTTTISPIKFTEFTEESDKPGKVMDKLSERPISTENVITESSSTFEEVAGKSEESVTSAIEETTMIRLKSTEEKEFISVATTTSPTDVRPTLSPAISSELSYSCEDSEDCAYVTSSESCDESGNCGEMTTKPCESEVCSEEEVVEDKSRIDTTPSPIMTKVPSATDLLIETQHTTVANVATTILTSRESENNSTIENVPITIDSRRSTTTSTPQHKLTLKVKVLLEHINENKEKHNLVELEKHLPLDENPEHHDNPDLIEQLKSLNKSVNMETINALLNCTTLGNLTRNPNFVSKEPGDAVDGSDQDFEFKNSDLEDLMLEQFTSGYGDTKNDYSDYQEHEVPPQRRRRRSLDDEMEDLNRLRRNLYDPNDSMVDSLNISKAQHAHVMKDNLQLFTTTNNPEEETSNTTYTESERNVTTEGDESTMPSTKMSLIDDVDLSNASESHDANLTNIQFTTTIFTTTNKPEEGTTNTIYIENEKNVTNEKNESAVPSIKENISNETKMEVVRETLPGIQEDVVVGLQHIASQLAQSNLTAVNNIKEIVKTNLLDIITDPLDNRVRSRRRRAATEEVGHWSNERVKEAPMGGNLRSFTEFTLYKVLP